MIPKAPVPPVAMLALRLSKKQTAGGGVMEGTCPRGVRSDPHPSGFPGAEGTLAFASALPFAG